MAVDSKGKQDLISPLPDAILQDILCFIPTKLAITTSLLSKRWRHVWCGTPSISLEPDYKRGRHVWCTPSINKTLTRYTAPKIMSFCLKTNADLNIPHRDKWIEFAMSRNVENLFLDFWKPCLDNNYKFPDFFYINSSIKQLNLNLNFCDTLVVPICPVSWTSLKTLFFRSCKIHDESMVKIISGCPVLESLTLYHCDALMVLDLSKSLRLTRLQVKRNVWVPGPTQIVAPHIRCLRLTNSQLPCTFVDVPSLREAKLDICFVSMYSILKADFLQVMVLKMLDKLQNAEKLTFRGNFLQILSLAELPGVRFPLLKVKALTLETGIFQYVFPPEHLDNYLKLQGLNTYECWRSKDGVFWSKNSWDVEGKHMISFVEFVLKNTKTLAKMVVLLDQSYLRFKIKELVPRLSHYNNVAIELKQTFTNREEEW